MSETENPAVTLTRLLKTNLRVVKDDNSLANVAVSGEWQNAEAFRGFDGQVTVGLAESQDQKLELSGNTRRRTSTLRVNVWATEQPGTGESARIIRGKIAEEVNRVIRQNRRHPNLTRCSFYGLGANSQTHKAFSGIGEAVPDATGVWVALASEDVQKLWASDDTRLELSKGGNGEHAALLFGFKVDARRNTVKQLTFLFEGYGAAPSGNGVVVKAWNRGSSSWENAQTGGDEGTDETVTVTLNQNLPNFVGEDGYVWFLARTVGASDGISGAVLSCDYVCLDVTVNGITYCDVVGYRDLDRVDVKPFVFRTEFTVKSWFFENIGEV